MCLNRAGGGVTVSCDLSILMATRKASTGILHAVLGTVLQEGCGLITENPDESKNSESLENLA